MSGCIRVWKCGGGWDEIPGMAAASGTWSPAHPPGSRERTHTHSTAHRKKKRRRAPWPHEDRQQTLNSPRLPAATRRETNDKDSKRKPRAFFCLVWCCVANRLLKNHITDLANCNRTGRLRRAGGRGRCEAAKALTGANGGRRSLKPGSQAGSERGSGRAPLLSGWHFASQPIARYEMG
jgi:hypothetical protein